MATLNMAKKIGVIAEDHSDVKVVGALLEKYAPANHFSIRMFVGNGCGKVKNKCDVWTQMLFSSGCEHVMLFHDLDRNVESKLRELLVKKIPKKTFPNSVVIIPIEEMEAWLLADTQAIKSVFNMKKTPKAYGNCELVQSPKEELKRIVWTGDRKRYLNTLHNEPIARQSSLLELLKCKSFVSFHDYVTANVFPSKLGKKTK